MTVCVCVCVCVCLFVCVSVCVCVCVCVCNVLHTEANTHKITGGIGVPVTCTHIM